MKRAQSGTAFHEAGHGVAAYFLGLSVGRQGPTIVPDKENERLGTQYTFFIACARSPTHPFQGARNCNCTDAP